MKLWCQILQVDAKGLDELLHQKRPNPFLELPLGYLDGFRFATLDRFASHDPAFVVGDLTQGQEIALQEFRCRGADEHPEIVSDPIDDRPADFPAPDFVIYRLRGDVVNRDHGDSRRATTAVDKEGRGAFINTHTAAHRRSP